MNKKIISRIKHFVSSKVSNGESPKRPTNVNVCEEYANAFRTQSYIDFWTRVLTISQQDSATCIPVESTTATRLSSYRLFAEYLLNPDQPTVNRILARTRIRPATFSLLSKYFSETADASVLCGSLLKDINHIRDKYRSFKKNIESFKVKPLTSDLLTQLIENPFGSTSVSITRVSITQSRCSSLLNRLESRRDTTRTKLKWISKLQHGSCVVWVALAVSLTVIITSHALGLLVAAPSFVFVSMELASMKKLIRESSQLDAAAKGIFILTRDLDTVTRLVTRLENELEHMQVLVKFWIERGDDGFRVCDDVARELMKNDVSFSERLDELEENLYLCFMTINRARKLVVKEIINR